MCCCFIDNIVTYFVTGCALVIGFTECLQIVMTFVLVYTLQITRA
jgi:hypothetical protein